MFKKKYIRLFPQTNSMKNVVAPYNAKSARRLAALKQEEKKALGSKYKSESSIHLSELTDLSTTNPDLQLLLLEAGQIMKITTNAIGISVYLVEPDGMYLLTEQQLIIIPSHYRFQIEERQTIAAHVAFRTEYVMVDDIKTDRRFPKGTGFHNDIAESVMCVPVVTPEGECLAIYELIRSEYDEPFSRDDLKLVIAVAGWMGAAIHQNIQRVALNKQKEMHDELLNITKQFFNSITSMTKMLASFVALAKDTVDVARGSFYVIDKDYDELTADAYEEGLDAYNFCLIKKNLKIKPLVKDRGVVTVVARNKNIVNVKDASKYPRIVMEPEIRTGRNIRSAFCMPLKGQDDDLIGIIRLLNKNFGYFTNGDKVIMKIFGSYSSCCLHYNNMMKRLRKLDLLNKIYEGQLNQSVAPCRHESNPRSMNVLLPSRLSEFRWYIPENNLHQAPYLAVNMIKDLNAQIGDAIDYRNLMNFILSTRKSYRNIPYHNFEHAFNFMHCMYNILKRNLHMFSLLEIRALMISSICHDVDHGGFTNNFLVLTNDVVYQLYNNSPWENHHFFVTAKLLHKYNIFKYDKRSNKLFLKEVREAILATDLQLHFKSRISLLSLLHEQKFSIADSSHKTLLKGLMMTVCDLSGLCKPFPIAKRIAENVYREFYEQGDREKEIGIIPLSMMDRQKQHQTPQEQIQFISVVVSPATEILESILPNTSDLNMECRLLQMAWEEIDEENDKNESG